MKQRPRYLLVTLDTEVDKDPRWRISNPPSFSSVTRGVPEILTPLFRRHGVRPTYLLSYEVLQDQASCQVLAGLGNGAELGTHLHVEFAPPEQLLFSDNMGGAQGNAIQAQLSAEQERAKLVSLGSLFRERFGYRPLSFRAGRFGMSSATPELLAELGYLVDSSVTPGLCWRYREGTIDYRRAPLAPHWLETSKGRLLELPVSVRPGGSLAPLVAALPPLPSRVACRLMGRRGRFHWLRPSWGGGEELVRYLRESSERFLVMMLHSMEVIPGASPYARSEEEAGRIVSAMDRLFAEAARAGIEFCTMAEAARLYGEGW
jgi:hypothetical protein